MRGLSRRRVSVAVLCLLVGSAVLAAVGARWRPDDSSRAGIGDVRVSRDAPATANDLRSPRGSNSPVLAVDPTNDRFVALANRMDDPDFSCALQLSGDGGLTWTAAEPLVALPDGVEKCYGPQVLFDAAGTLYYLFVGLAGQGNRPQGAWLTTSVDRGRSFARPWRILEPNNYQVRLALDRALGEQGRLHLVWLRLGDQPTLGGLPATRNPIVTAYSDDGGKSFSDPIEISGQASPLVVAPMVTIGADHAVHVVYYDLEDDVRDYRGLPGPVWPETWAITVASSTDGGTSFGQAVVVTSDLQPPERVMLIFTMPPPAVAADTKGNVYVAWHDARQGDWDVFTARSGDRGKSWDEPVRVNNDGQGSGGHQLLPQLATSSDGRVDVIFFDRQQDPKNIHQDVAYAASYDGGKSFSPARRISSYPSDSRSGPRYHLRSAQGKVELGAGLALNATGRKILAAWPDSRFAPPGTAQQDIFTAVLTQNRSGITFMPWAALVLLGAIVGCGTYAAVVIVRRRRRADTDAPAPPSGAERVP